MRKNRKPIKGICYVIIVMLLFQVACVNLPKLSIQSKAANVGNVDVAIEGTMSYTNAVKVLELVNIERAAQGYAPLVMDNSLLIAAMGRAAECSLSFSHTRPDGLLCFTACSKMNGENIAVGASTPEEVMKDWISSPGHKGNILGSGYRSIGIGCFIVDGVTYWSQCFSSSDAQVATPLQDGDVAVSTEVKESSLTLTAGVASTSINTGEQVEMVIKATTPESFTSTVIAGTSLKWSSSNVTVATVKDGLITGGYGGSAIITATLGGLSCSLPITVIGAAKEDGVSIVTMGDNTYVTDDKSNGKYQIIDETNGYVAYDSPLVAAKTITIPASVMVGGKYYKVTKINKKAFCKQKKITKVTIGKNVKEIGTKAFYGCKNLKKIVVKSKKITKIGKKAFYGIHKKATITVPKSKKKAYKKLMKKAVSKKNSVTIK